MIKYKIDRIKFPQLRIDRFQNSNKMSETVRINVKIVKTSS